MKANLLKALIKAKLEGDDKAFKTLALQIAANEAANGHSRLAKEIRDLVDKLDKLRTKGQKTGTHTPVIPIARPSKELSSLLLALYPKERVSDMVLHEDILTVLRRVLEEQKNLQLFASHGLTAIRKLMLVGPPGCGKTMTAKVLAGELGLPLFIVRLEGLLSRYLGETSVHLSSIFQAMETNRGVYLFDEFDSIGTFRGDQRDIGEIRRVLSTFLQLIESDTSESLIITATNYEKVLDNALFRRFDEVIEFKRPDKEQIAALLEKSLKVFSSKDIEWAALAEGATGLSYADITKAASEAAKTALLVKSKVTNQHIQDALGKIMDTHNRINS